jgi:hypothetical protein
MPAEKPISSAIAIKVIDHLGDVLGDDVKGHAATRRRNIRFTPPGERIVAASSVSAPPADIEEPQKAGRVVPAQAAIGRRRPLSTPAQPPAHPRWPGRYKHQHAPGATGLDQPCPGRSGAAWNRSRRTRLEYHCAYRLWRLFCRTSLPAPHRARRLVHHPRDPASQVSPRCFLVSPLVFGLLPRSPVLSARPLPIPVASWLDHRTNFARFSDAKLIQNHRNVCVQYSGALHGVGRVTPCRDKPMLIAASVHRGSGLDDGRLAGR